MKYFRYIVYLFVIVGFSSASAGSYEDYFRALMRDDAVTVRKLLAQGFDPNARDEHGQVGLYAALRAESYKSAEVLVAQPTLDVNARNEAGESVLMMAALRGQLELCKQLMARGAEVNPQGWTPLHYAASGGGEAVTALLLSAGAQIDARSPRGLTPLMMAVRYDTEATVNLLLSRGADVTALSEAGLTPADYARQGDREWLVPRLTAPGNSPAKPPTAVTRQR